MALFLSLLLICASLSVPTARAFLQDVPRRTHFQSILSRNPNAGEALYELLGRLTGPPPELAFLFVGQHHEASFTHIIEEASNILGVNTRVLALVGGGVVGGGSEIDEPTLPAMSLLSGVLPKDAGVELFSFNELHAPPPEATSEYWQKLAGNSHTPKNNTNNHKNNCRPASYVLFADPWSPLDAVLQGLEHSNKRHGGGATIVTGGISLPTSTHPTVAMDGKAMPQGSAVGVCFTGNIGLQAIVAQGCRPVGSTFTVTAVSGNMILELNEKPALSMLEQVTRKASDQDKKLISSGNLLCGIGHDLLSIHPQNSNSGGSKDDSAQNDQDSSSNARDFLARRIAGFQPPRGAIVLSNGKQVKEGDAFCFQVRDKQAAVEDMQLMMQRHKTERLFAGPSQSGTPVAALQVSCTSRGRSLYGQANVDLSSIVELFSSTTSSAPSNEDEEDKKEHMPIAGFFANGEIGPVGIKGLLHSVASEDREESNFIHDFSTVVAILCDYSDEYSSTGRNQAEDGAPVNKEPEDTWG